MLRAQHLLAVTSLVAVALLVVTLRRVPTPTPDADFYASIARSQQLHGVGIPSVLRYSPVAVDHIPFYGPVYFTLLARLFDWSGVSLLAVRTISLAGALLMVAAAALLAQSVASAPWRWLWAATMLLLTTEVRTYATVGTMATLAIGFETAALAVFVRGLRANRRWAWYGAGAGVFLSLAALTTPRTCLFIAAFFVAGAVCPGLPRDRRRHAWQQLVVTLAIVGTAVGVWAIVSHGGVTDWARYVSFILLHEDSDVGILASSHRQLFFSVGNAAMTFVAATCGLVAAALLSRRSGIERNGADAGIAGFALLTGWLTFVASLVTLNVTFTQTTYIALPLFIVVLAMPYESLRLPPRVLPAAAVAVLAIEAGLAGIWYARVAATWAARDPEPLYRFVDRYVPDGAAVIGPNSPYFIAVERSGARYRSVWPESWADWARWVPVVEPLAVVHARQAPVTATQGKYLIWFANDELPEGYACASTHPVAVYERPPDHLALLGWLGARTWDTGYPKSILYRLPSGCPTGYDPTHS